MAKARHAPSVGEPNERKAPTITRTDDAGIHVDAVEKHQLQTLYGVKTEEAAKALLTSALNAVGENTEAYLDFMPAIAIELEPQDAVEAMLVTQMAATHVALSRMSLLLSNATSVQLAEAYERSTTRLSRTYLAQMEALKKYRAKAHQTVRVERVEVQDGGQAIVGDVSYRRGEDGGK